MMITKLQRRVSSTIIHFDDGSNLIVDNDYLINVNLHQDNVVSEKSYLDIIERAKFIEVRNSAFRYLSRRIHSRGELELKLLKKKYPNKTIKRVLNELGEKNYLNDKEFCEKFLEEKIYSKKWGLVKIIAHLRNKGIDEAVIQDVINKNDLKEVTTNNINRLINNKLRFLKNKNLSDTKLKQRLFSFLISRGFTFEESKNAIDKLMRQK
jgi:regulatory protein